MRENLKYCVILPAFNEGRHLATVVGRIPDWVDGIIGVDDASTDDTLKVAESLADPRVRVQHHAMLALRLLRRCENLATDRYHVPG
jgi:glycosyltransferase involved in cell wall biosynthesis